MVVNLFGVDTNVQSDQIEVNLVTKIQLLCL